MASEASHITHEVFGEIRAGGSSLARPRADLLVLTAIAALINGNSERGKDRKNIDSERESNACLPASSITNRTSYH